MITTKRAVIRCALYTALYLSGGMLVSFLIAFTISSLPMHMSQSANAILGFTVFMLTTILAGALWGRSLARLLNYQNKRPVTLAGTLCFGPALLLMALALGRLEVLLIEQGRGPGVPIHVMFTLLFVTAAFVVAAIGGLALGAAHKDGWLAARLGLGAGAAGAVGFLLVNLMMYALGWQVGAPGAASRATMVVVMITCSIGASLGSGGALGFLLTKRQDSGMLSPEVEFSINKGERI